MSPTSAEASEDESGPISAKSWHTQDHEPEIVSPAGSGRSGSDEEDRDVATDAGADAPSLPVQKRRRVTRACDECRRKKIKCDGKQPCTHCSVYSYECTYDKPSNRRRNPAPQYIEALENRLQRAESLLRQFMPDVDLTDPNLDPAVKQEFRNRERARAQAAKLKQAQMGLDPSKEDAQLLSMIESIGQLDLDEKGEWDFHGASSGVVFLRRMKEHFCGMLGPTEKVPFLPNRERPGGLLEMESPQSAGSSPFGSSTAPSLELPPKEIVRDLCYYSLNCATCLIRIVHVPSFYENLDKIYSKPLDSLNPEETHFLGLLYAVMALGCMYRNLDETKPQKTAYRDVFNEGQRYYNTAKRIFNDVTECRDITSLQTLLFMILFLQATVNLSGCYSFVGIALRSALRMGLHRHLQHDLISPIEQEVRKRVFYIIRQMDIYVSTLLGFPLLLNREDIDQEYPAEIDDQYIRQDTILTPPPGTPSIFEAFNAHSRLMEILANIVKHVYPTKGLAQSVMKGDRPNTTYAISYARMKEIEHDLQEWYEKLPETWRPSTEGPIEIVRVRHLLRFAYAHVQLVLYRPFLHYVSPRLSQGKNVDDLSYACAAAAISVSRNIVHIGIEIRKQGVLIGPYWFMLYTEFFAILSLVFYSTENPHKQGSVEVLADAKAGREMISNLVDKSLAAERVTKALDVLFDQLPKRMNVPAGATAPPSKKRSATSKDSTGAPAAMQQRRSEELARPHARTTTNGYAAHPPPRASFDGVPVSSSIYQDTAMTAFQANMPDLLPLDVPSRTTPDSASGSVASSARPGPFATPTTEGLSSLHKLDALMFPSEDPFAYPNQPMMELGFQQKVGGSEPAMSGPQQEASSFFMSGAFDDMESQLMGQMPPFVMHEGHGGLDFSGSMYQSPVTATSGSGGGGGMGGRGGQAHGMAHSREEEAKREQLRRQQERQLEQILAAQRFRGDWGSFGRGGFQGL